MVGPQLSWGPTVLGAVGSREGPYCQGSGAPRHLVSTLPSFQPLPAATGGAGARLRAEEIASTLTAAAPPGMPASLGQAGRARHAPGVTSLATPSARDRSAHENASTPRQTASNRRSPVTRWGQSTAG